MFADNPAISFSMSSSGTEPRIQLRRKAFRRDLSQQFFPRNKCLSDSHSIFIEKPLRLRVHQRYRRPRQDGRDTSKKFFVEHFRLRKVCNLRRTANISQCRQQIVLDHRTKQRIATEILRRLFNAPNQLLRAKLFLRR